jgi:membrane fusion protein, heavy metal efflux system
MPVRRSRLFLGLIGFVVCLLAVAAWGFSDRWLPQAQIWMTGKSQSANQPAADAQHEGHDHAHEDEHAHDDSTSLELSEQAGRNIGLKTGVVALQDYQRAITIPAMVAERPGRTRVQIAAPLTSIVTGVYAVAGEAVNSETLLFRLRLTHEDLVQTQTDFVNTLGQLDVERREIARLERVTSSGAVAGKVLLDRQYERDKLEATSGAQREAMLLHGLSEEQVEQIAETRKLIREITIAAPFLHEDSSLHHESEAHVRPVANVSDSAAEDESHTLSEQLFVVTELHVTMGKSVQSGEPLCTLADFSELYLEGLAFEQDADEIAHAAGAGQTVSAVLHNGSAEEGTVRDLEIAYVANEVDVDSRTLHFYVRLPNRIVQDQAGGQRRFVTWRFKPGQRMQVRVPVERWSGVIVLPVEAVAQEGPEAFVFVENGSRFDRRPVHVTYRDQRYAAIANDGSIYPGETVALNSAHQLQMALKISAGGGVDPHAGHNH